MNGLFFPLILQRRNSRMLFEIPSQIRGIRKSKFIRYLLQTFLATIEQCFNLLVLRENKQMFTYMKRLLHMFSKKKVKTNKTHFPLPSVAPGYIGMTLGEIRKFHSNPNINPEKLGNGMEIIEIRLKYSTLACRMQNNICTEAYVFKDEEVNYNEN